MRQTGASSQSGKEKVDLTPKLDSRLVAYATAATAAGVGLLATSQAAEAKIVYTKADVVINHLYSGVILDLNNDGVADFSFYYARYPGARVPLGFHSSALNISPKQSGNGVWEVNEVVNGFTDQCVAALPAKAKVGPGAPFVGSNPIALWFSNGTAYETVKPGCFFKELHRGAFLGLKFMISGEVHYGWAHVTHSDVQDSNTLDGYAYETVANQPIFTGKTSGTIAEVNSMQGLDPQPATLGMLAAGARGLEIWRRAAELVL